MPTRRVHTFQPLTNRIEDPKERSKRGMSDFAKVSKLLLRAVSSFGAYCAIALILEKQSNSWHGVGFVSLAEEDHEHTFTGELTNERHFLDSTLNHKGSIGYILQCFCNDVITSSANLKFCKKRGEYICIVSYCIF